VPEGGRGLFGWKKKTESTPQLEQEYKELWEMYKRLAEL